MSFSLGIERVFEDVGEVSVCVMLVDVEDGLLRRTVQYIVTSGEFKLILIDIFYYGHSLLSALQIRERSIIENLMHHPMTSNASPW